MPFQPGPVRSLTLPEGNPAMPGFDSLVLGSELPAELKAAGYIAAQVWYHGAWDPTSSKPQVKYYYVAMIRVNNSATYPSGLDIGYVWCANPAANATGVIKVAFQEFHAGNDNTVNVNLLPANVANAIMAIGTRLLIDTDNGILEFRPSDLAYPRVGCINFANGFFNTGTVVGQAAYGWCKKDAVGVIHMQALFGVTGNPAAGSKICELPFNTYLPKSGHIYTPVMTQPNALGFVRIETTGSVYAVTALVGYVALSAQWPTSP